ncbi:hypothetical protein Lac2_23210 [Claveliimonas bilis]|uniref:restriction endonuclease subunit S n=1 Tax=Claveliimonas bilis TaxID=3028070 RepID=UPI00292ED950|nr:restriction endonuclease subunit S [Claveliimonas bilis]BDZ84187.1 hypothetical protein Lac2_23210 [Claveliimonas bilis]
MLRFKRDDGTSYPEWEEKRLEDIVLFLDEKRKPITSNLRNKGIYPYYGASGIIDYVDEYIFDEELVLLSEDGANIIDRNYPVCYIAKGKYWVNNHAHVLKSKEGLNNYLLKELLEKIDYKKYNSGTAQPKLNQETCRKLVVNIPCLEEQQKIADFLSEVDNIIAMSEKEIESLEMQKKGAMQKIFSHEVRFKADDGSEYPEWEEKKISELFNISAGGDIDREKCTSEKTDSNIYPVYANAITKNGLYGYTDTFKIDGETITVTGRGDVGIAKARKEKYYPIVRLLVLTPKNKLDVLFFEAVINKIKFYEEYTGVPQLTAPQIGKMKVKFPCLEEQQKIADLLSEFDNAIEYAKEELEVWMNIKKGLLQQMFE